MKPSITFSASIVLAALAGSACSDGPSLNDLNQNPGSSGGSASTAGSSSATAGSAGSSVVPNGGSAGTSASTGGSAPVAGTSSSTGGSEPVAGASSTGGSEATAGSAPVGGTGGSGGSGGGGTEPTGPYSDRSGTFKMLVLTRTAGYRHASSIESGTAMLKEIAAEQGIIQLEFADTKEQIDAVMNPTKLAEFEIIFHLNTTGDVFTAAQQTIYQTWMEDDGAFAGVHAATDTENGWAFYSEVTGQYYNGHTIAGTQGQILFETAAADFPAIKGLPNPWSRAEEWYNFNSYQQWSVKPGFKVLGRKQADQQPIVWAREWGNFRSFYTAIGHDAPVFKDAAVKKHLTGGIMWAVRRDKLIK